MRAATLVFALVSFGMICAFGMGFLVGGDGVTPLPIAERCATQRQVAEAMQAILEMRR